MSRPLTGSERMVGPGVWEMTVPVKKLVDGKSKTVRKSHRFKSLSAARAWRDEAVEAIKAGRPVPEPTVAPVEVAPSAVAATYKVMSLAEVAAEWFEHHKDHETVGHDRGEGVRTDLSKWILPFFGDVSDMRMLQLKHGDRFSRFLAGEDISFDGTPMVDPAGRLILSTDPEQEMTMSRASAESGLSVNRLRRALFGDRPCTGDEIVTPADLADTGLMVLRRPRGLAPDTAQDTIWVLHQLIRYAVTTSAMEKLPWAQSGDGSMGQLTARTPAESRRLRPERPPREVKVEAVRSIAGRLHWAYQLTLWILRLMGLRIGEAFGLQVGDIHRASWGARCLHRRAASGRSAVHVPKRRERGHQPRVQERPEDEVVVPGRAHPVEASGPHRPRHRRLPHRPGHRGSRSWCPTHPRVGQGRRRWPADLSGGSQGSGLGVRPWACRPEGHADQLGFGPLPQDSWRGDFRADGSAHRRPRPRPRCARPALRA